MQLPPRNSSNTGSAPPKVFALSPDLQHLGALGLVEPILGQQGHLKALPLRLGVRVREVIAPGEPEVLHVLHLPEPSLQPHDVERRPVDLIRICRVLLSGASKLSYGIVHSKTIIYI